MNSPQAGQDLGHTQSIKQIDSKRTDFGTVIQFNELVPNAGFKQNYLQSSLDQKIMLLQQSFAEADSLKNPQLEEFQPIQPFYQNGRNRNEENHNPRQGKQPEQKTKGVNGVEYLSINERSLPNFVDQSRSYNDEADQKSSVSDHLKLRSASVEQRHLDLENLQMPELQEYKHLRQKQMGRAEQNLLKLMEENTRLQKKIQAQRSLVQNRRFQSLDVSGSIRKQSNFQQSQHEQDDSQLDIRDSRYNKKSAADQDDWNDYEIPVNSYQSREQEVTATSKDDQRLEEDLKVLAKYNNVLQDKFNAMQEEAIKNEIELKQQIRAVKEASNFNSSNRRSLRDYEKQADEQKAFQSQIASIQQQLKHLQHRFKNKQNPNNQENHTDLASRRGYREELRLMNRKFDQLRNAVLEMSRALIHEPHHEKAQRNVHQSLDFSTLRSPLLQQESSDLMRKQISRSSISNMLQDVRGSQERISDYSVPKHISTFNQHSQLKHQRVQLRQPDIIQRVELKQPESNQLFQNKPPESRHTIESAYVFTPAKSLTASKGIPSLNISANSQAYDSPYQQSRTIPVHARRLPNLHHKVEQVGNTFSIKAVDTGLPTLQYLQKKNDKLEIHMWSRDNFDTQGLTQKLNQYAAKKNQT